AHTMGFEEGFRFNSPAEIFAEHAALSGFRNSGKRFFDISALSTLSEGEYHDMKPVRWPAIKGSKADSTRLFSDGRFNTPSGRARMPPITPTAPISQVSETYPLVLNTGRIRDQWHTMTRTGKASRLLNHIDQPYVELSFQDAADKGLAENDLVEIRSAISRCLARAKITSGQPVGSVFMPIHWTAQFASLARVDSLFASIKDPISGQPEAKHCPVSINKLNIRWQAILITEKELANLPCEYWSKIPLKSGFRYELAGTQLPENWKTWIKSVVTFSDDDQVELNSGETYRLVSFSDQIPELLFFASTEKLPNSNWLSKQFDQITGSPAQRMALLAGKPVDNNDDSGAIVCSCFEVGEKSIRQAIRQGADNIDKLAKQLKCGSNCGSCLPEIRAML
ncbi:MAG: (2Fe-2S)-binding protein, partial [Amphritea sp.]|nr:(2Fe-2S)-binding protein [Amphritea sp.]